MMKILPPNIFKALEINFYNQFWYPKWTATSLNWGNEESSVCFWSSMGYRSSVADVVTEWSFFLVLSPQFLESWVKSIWSIKSQFDVVDWIVWEGSWSFGQFSTEKITVLKLKCLGYFFLMGTPLWKQHDNWR